ncbi:hypothetical protein [Bradyrhizobium sp. DOA1]|uniref:hypothetical protein n=1 Tax=Bradyrhizobium sp. DOA1 TaxID=1126616 RepID=UPI000A8A3488|nr:hypothetical protein [Bradyrhizobium sp. DOA1]
MPLLLLGFASILWYYLALPSIRSAAAVRDVSARILSDDRLKPGAISKMAAQVADRPKLKVEQSESVRGEALILLRAAEEATGKKPPDEVDREVKTAEEKIEFSLSVNPTDSFLWLMLYSTAISRDGLDSHKIRYLDQSYIIAPFEGWIALRRNRVGLAVFPILAETTMDKVVSEFAALIDSNFVEEAVTNFESVNLAERARLLSSLDRVNRVSLESFAKKLRRNGLKASVPGVEIDARPWQ